MTIGRIVARTLGLLGMSLLLAAGSAQAQTVLRDGDNAIGIDDLEILGSVYNVTFVFDTLDSVYGPPPGVFRFDRNRDAKDATDAINAALNGEGGILSVGPNEAPIYGIGFAHFPYEDLDVLITRDALFEEGAWILRDEPGSRGWEMTTTLAQFELASTGPTTTVAATTTTSTGTTTTGAGTTTTSAGTTTTGAGTTTTSAGTTTTGAGTTTTSAGTTTTTGATTTTIVQVALCSEAPIKGCFAATKGSLKVKEKKVGKESFKAQLQKFDGATTQAEFGNPLADGGTAYEICIWTPDGFVERLLVDQAGQTCGKKSKECWKDKKGKGWDYKDDLAASDGVKKIKLQSGDAGKGKVQADAANNEKKGQTALPTGIAADLQGATIALVQVTTTDAACYQALLSDVKKNDGVQFEAKVAKDSGDGGGSGPLCGRELCAEDEALSQQCEDFVQACLTFEAVNEDECAGGGILICEGGPPDGTDPGNVCSMNLCAANAGLAQECQDFLDTCLLAGEPEEDCVGAALFICLAEETL